MSEQNTKDERVVREILEAAKCLFSQYGLKKTTMEDVGKATGKGKSTLYYYFPGKTELFEAVVNDELKRLVQEIRKAINAESSSKGKLKAFLVLRLKLRDTVQNLGEVVYNEISTNYAEICRIKAHFESLQVDFIKEIVTGGVQSGEFKALTPDEISFYSMWTAAAFSGLELPSSTSACLTATEGSCDRIVDFILYGIGK